MRHYETIARHKSIIYTIGLINFLFTLHLAITAYVDSSYLSLFTSQDFIGEIYMAVGAVTILAFFLIYRILKKFGDYATSTGLILLDALTLLGVIWGGWFWLIAVSFVLNMAIVALISFTDDVFLETYTDTAHTGGVRGFFLTLTNGAWILSPLLAGMLIYNHVYSRVYIAALLLLAPVLYLVHKNLHHFHDSAYEAPSAWTTLREIARLPDIWKLCIVNIILQTFYAWMVIYLPLYLANQIGFDWSSIGIILTIMLVPFVLIQLPFGRLADERYGEKTLMGIGFAIMGLSTIVLAFVGVQSLIVWAGALFVTRIGAALAEVMIETYFFKKIPARDSNILSVFRMTRQVPYFLAPILTGVGLFFTSNAGLFFILGVVCLAAIGVIVFIRDVSPLVAIDKERKMTATGKLP
ncbi:MAG: MFS transporter [Candidatus Pacebacteria bacterium]|nr:MFS transporter [Candidatus Paceibacterota bacterium]